MDLACMGNGNGGYPPFIRLVFCPFIAIAIAIIAREKHASIFGR